MSTVNSKCLFYLHCTVKPLICRVPLTRVRKNDVLKMYRAAVVNLKNKYAPDPSSEPLTNYKDVRVYNHTVVQHVSSLAHNVMYELCV